MRAILQVLEIRRNRKGARIRLNGHRDALFSPERDGSMMQASAITISPTLPPPGATGSGSSNRLIPATANFARAFADQVSAPRPAALKDASAAASPAVSPAAQTAATVQPDSAKKLTPQLSNNPIKLVQADSNPGISIAPNLAVPSPTVQAEPVIIQPPQSDSPPACGGTSETLAARYVTTYDMHASTPALPLELPGKEAVANPGKAEASGQQTEPSPAQNISSEKKTGGAGSPEVAQSLNQPDVKLLREMAASGVPANQNSSQVSAYTVGAAPAVSTDPAFQAPQASVFATPAPPSPPAAQAAILTQEAVASAHVQPASAPAAAPNTAGIAQQASTLAGESTPQTRPIAVKAVSGPQNAPSKTNPLPASAADSLPTREIAQAAAIHGGKKNLPDHVPPREFIGNAAGSTPTKSDYQNQFGAEMAAGQKLSDTSQPDRIAPGTPPANANPPVDPNSVQATNIPSPLANEQAAAQISAKVTPQAAAASDVTPRPPQNAGNPAMQQGPDITNVQIAGSSAHSEIHLAMQADKLGAVELHARVTGDHVGAAIIVEKKEAHAALAVELPLLQQALAEKNLSVAHVWLTQGAPNQAFGHSGNTGNGPGQQSRNEPELRYMTNQEEEPHVAPLFRSAETIGIFDERGHLSVRA